MTEYSEGSPAKATLEQRLKSARRPIVGRESEKELFAQALEALDPPFVVLHIYGPGGVGKTTLLHEFMRLSAEHKASPIYLDARHIDPSPQGFMMVLCLSLGLALDSSPFDYLKTLKKPVLLLDTFELFSPLDTWLRESFIPQLPETALLVFAGRTPLSTAWRSDEAWQQLLRTISLRNLLPEESHSLLIKRGVPENQHAGLLEFSHGHPLALSLVADVINQTKKPFQLNEAADIVQLLLKRFIEEAPSSLHRQALEACSQVSSLNEAQLREALNQEDVFDIFAWLRTLSFIDQGPFGLFPHDLARELIDADFRWRDPEGYNEIHRRVREYYFRQMDAQTGLEKLRSFFDLNFLHRHNPVVKPFWKFSEIGSAYIDLAKSSDFADILAITEKYEGQATVEIVRFYLQKRPEAFRVARGANPEIEGFYISLKLQDLDEDDLNADPALAVILKFMTNKAALRPNDNALMLRLFIDKQEYQLASAVTNQLTSAFVLEWWSLANLSWVVLCTTKADYWYPFFLYYDMERSKEADFKMDGKTFGVFARDFRPSPVSDYVRRIGERELVSDLTVQGLEREPAPQQLFVLSHPDFSEAVKQALRDYHQANALAKNPLLRSSLVKDAEDKLQGLQVVLKDAAFKLKDKTKDEKFYRALNATFFESALTQELAAERLGLPFGTYRYQLNVGIERLTDYLWQLELRS